MWSASVNPNSPSPLLQGYPLHRSRTVVGLISGTSVDGIDVAVLELPPWESRTRPPTLLDFETVAYPNEVRRKVMDAAHDRLSVRETAELHHRIGQLFGRAATDVLGGRRADLVASHGQTVYHAPESSLSLQLGEPAWIARLTGCVTVSDFRVADMTYSGQGAPLVPKFDAYLLRADRLRIAVNLGGIANITVIEPDGGPVTAWDTGPANCLSDALCRAHGLGPYDAGGERAAVGQTDPALLEELLEHPYFALEPPKSTGLEDFGEVYAAALEGRGTVEDVIRTTLALAAETLSRAIHYASAAGGHRYPVELVFAGGGASNPVLMEEIAVRVQRLFHESKQSAPRLLRYSEFGIDEDAREAAAFAYLGDCTAMGLPGNFASATGADRPAILGKVNWPSGPVA